MVAYNAKINDVRSFEVEVPINESAVALAEITSGSGRLVNALTLNNVRLNAVDLRVLNAEASATATPAAPYGIKAFYIGEVAGDSNVIGTTTSLSFNSTAINDTESVDAGGRKFDRVTVGLEFTGGTTAFTADYNVKLSAIGSSIGTEIIIPAAGNDSFATPGSSLAFAPTTTDFTVTTETESTAL